MQNNFTNKIVLIFLLVVTTFTTSKIYAQSPQIQRFKVENGVLTEVKPRIIEDSAYLAKREDRLKADSILLLLDSDTLTRAQKRQIKLQDPNRYSRLFKDSITISNVCWISTVVPGFGQLYNEQYWKIPIVYTTLGLSLSGVIVQNNKYQTYKTQYDNLVRQNASRDELDPVQTNMIKYNTRRQLCIGAMAASYLYFLGDAAVNYAGVNTNVKKATTLSTIFPGAGQFYNKSYWKIPIVLGGIATFAYVIDYNARGYNRFTLAYDLLTDGDDSTVDEFGGIYSSTFIDNYRDSYRRNRDLGIILMAGWYLLNIVDAHVDAHFKNYDISDDLAFDIVPSVNTCYTQSTGSVTSYGMSLNFRF
ncbi:MAG: DUF5683 domain-containing protein [Rikenellaceae bacterium]